MCPLPDLAVTEELNSLAQWEIAFGVCLQGSPQPIIYRCPISQLETWGPRKWKPKAQGLMTSLPGGLSFWQDVPIRDELAVILQPGRVSESPGAIAPPHSPPTEVWIQSLGVWKIYDFNQNLMVCVCSVLKTDVWEPLVWRRTLQKQMEDFLVFMYLFSHPHKNLKHYENPREHCMGSLNVMLNDMKINGH